MSTNVTSTRSTVKVKVTELLKLRTMDYSRSISSAVLACSAKLMVGGDRMKPGLQLVGARFLGLEIKCVRPYVRTDVHKVFFSDFDPIWCVGRPRPDMPTRLTLTRSKVKVKVTELLNFRILLITAYFQVYLFRHFRV